MKKLILVMLLGTSLVGCDFSYYSTLVDNEPPVFSLAIGYEVQISDVQKAKVYGSNHCEAMVGCGDEGLEREARSAEKALKSIQKRNGISIEIDYSSQYENIKI